MPPAAAHDSHTCTGKLSQADADALEEALWAWSVRAAGLSSGALPPELRPMDGGEALDRLGAARDPQALRRALAASYLVLGAAGRLTALSDAQTAKGLPHIEFDLILKLLLRVAVQVRVATMTMRRFVDQIEFMMTRVMADSTIQAPCSEPESFSCYVGTHGQTRVLSSVLVNKPLGDLVRVLDPQTWAQCGSMFRETTRIADAASCRLTPAPSTPGTSWHGLLYERAVVGVQEVEHILRVFFTDCSQDACNPTITVCYRLHRTMSFRVGPWRLPGMLRQNSGMLLARPATDKGKTQICVSKDVQYGRMTTWRASTLVDVGEILNYCAPAMLTRWVTDLKLIVPCC